MDKNSIAQKIIIAGLILYCLGAATSTFCQAGGVILALIGWIIRTIMARRCEIRGTPLNLPILFFIITLFLSIIFSPYRIEALSNIDSIIRKIALYYLVVCGIRNSGTAKRLIIVLLVAAGIESGYIILQYLYNFKIWGIVFHDGVTKDLTQNRALGSALGIIFPIGFSLWLFPTPVYKRIILGVSSLLILSALLLTSTRGALLGVVLALIFIVIWFASTYKNKKILLCLFAVVIVIPFLLPKNITTRALSIFSDKTLGGRIYIWRDSLQICRDYPLFGIGHRTFEKVYYPEYFSKEARENKDFGHRHCHNNFLNVAVEGGILGLGAFIWLLISSFSLSFRILKETYKDKDLFPLFLGFWGGLLVWLVEGMVDCTYLGSSAYLFWFILGMMVLCYEERHTW